MTMQRSSSRNPCPCCGRTKTSHCAWALNGSDDDLVLCHNGERFGPPPGLAIGDVLTIAGRSFALTAVGKGFAGSSHVFRPHQERQPDPGFRLPAAVRRANAALLELHPLAGASLEEQLACLRRDIHRWFDAALAGHVERLDALRGLHERCRHLLPQLRRGLRSDPTLTPFSEELTDLLRQVRHELQFLERCQSDEAYRLAWRDLAPTELQPPEPSDWLYWQRQKAAPSHPWVQECQLAGEAFWYPVG